MTLNAAMIGTIHTKAYFSLTPLYDYEAINVEHALTVKTHTFSMDPQ
jgi:hypothetical protein